MGSKSIYLQALHLRGASDALVRPVGGGVLLEGLWVVELDLAGVADVPVLGVRVQPPVVETCRLEAGQAQLSIGMSNP